MVEVTGLKAKVDALKEAIHQQEVDEGLFVSHNCHKMQWPPTPAETTAKTIVAAVAQLCDGLVQGVKELLLL